MIKGIGIDTIEISRIDRIHRRYGNRFLKRVLTTDEQDYVRRWKAPQGPIAARFAAKEACMKALGTGWRRGIRWRDIEVISSPEGKPILFLHGEAKKRFSELSASSIHCSITHSREHAIAVVVIE